METQGALSFSELVLNASFLVQCVMLFLLALSVISWTIIISRNNQYRIGRAKADEFEDRFWSGIDLNNLYQDCMKRPDELVGLEVIYSAGFKEFVRLVNSGPADQDVVMDGTYRQMKVACSREVELLENHLPTLATIGSISPYIGLFGTVWGIMHAFVSLAAVKNATLAMVAPPIAEALIATAMGLFAAIPAVMFYNRFVTKVEALENRYYNFMDEFSTILNRRLVTIRSQINRTQQQPQAAANTSSVSATMPGMQNLSGVPSMTNLQGVSNLQGVTNLPSMPNMPGVPSMQGGSNLPGGSNLSGALGAVEPPASGPGLNPNATHSTGTNSTNVNPARNRFNTNRVQVDMNSSQAQDMAKAMHSPLAPEANGDKPAPVLGGGASLPSANSARLTPRPNNPLQGPVKRTGLNSSAEAVLGGMPQESMRGVVPPRNASSNLGVNAQLPGGAASAVKPSVMPVPGLSESSGAVDLNPAASSDKGSEGPMYRAGANLERRPKPNDDEPHYITPGGQNQRRMPK